MIKRPDQSDYPPFYETYISLIGSSDILSLLEMQSQDFYVYVKAIPGDKTDFRYAEGKWTVKEVIGHIVEVERIMAYRALAISRKDPQHLPGMDEKLYITNSSYRNIGLADLAEEFNHVRKGNIYLVKNLTPIMLNQKGMANNSEISVAALVYILAGHLQHHLNILKERYFLQI